MLTVPIPKGFERGLPVIRKTNSGGAMEFCRRAGPCTFDDLIAPLDIAESSQLFNVNCGPAAFAALLGCNILDIISFFPQYPEKPWTNRTQMQAALSSANLPWRIVPDQLPVFGVCLLQFEGPWSNYTFRLARLRHTHWIAVRNGYVFDINWEGWLPRQNWEEVVLDDLVRSRRHCSGWKVLTSYGLTSGNNPEEELFEAPIQLATSKSHLYATRRNCAVPPTPTW